MESICWIYVRTLFVCPLVCDILYVPQESIRGIASPLPPVKLGILVSHRVLLLQTRRAGTRLQPHNIRRHYLPLISVDDLRDLFQRRSPRLNIHAAHEDKLEEDPNLLALVKHKTKTSTAALTA